MPESTHDRVKELTRQLETGIQDLYASGRYGEYLAMLSKFHKYSYGNIMLIMMQCPHASMVAGFQTWKKEFQRNVKKGERGIRVLAPCPIRRKLDSDEEKEDTVIPYFKAVTVFDISQTEGKELPAQIVTELTDDVEGYNDLFNSLVEYSGLPVTFEPLPKGYKGSFYREEQRISLAPGMSQSQTIKTLVHEIAHSKLHNDGEKRDRSQKEVEAESGAYVVCNRLGIDTSDYSFGYVAGWSKNKELPELKASLELIRSTAAGMIDAISPEKETAPPERKAQKIYTR